MLLEEDEGEGLAACGRKAGRQSQSTTEGGEMVPLGPAFEGLGDEVRLGMTLQGAQQALVRLVQDLLAAEPCLIIVVRRRRRRETTLADGDGLDIHPDPVAPTQPVDVVRPVAGGLEVQGADRLGGGSEETQGLPGGRENPAVECIPAGFRQRPRWVLRFRLAAASKHPADATRDWKGM